ncbi:MAG: helix-turn-helix domain-containing protein [Treponema sp.]|nr:helix-turn-helix domain-containing protein [Treponema sp.]
MDETFWDRTNRLIKECGFTQETLTQKCQFEDPRRIQNLSGGNRFPRALELVRIARELRTTVEYLVTGERSYDQDLLDAFHRLNDEGRENAILLVKALETKYPLPLEQAGVSS